ncbi:Holliday junction resolvase RuvX [Riemerella anatipestifer]|uniref:Holliday junction resolvase RuvX n=1 Tax=Riemerella anatipestifer TaxID=34085 RepID=UPI002A8DD4F6|nr:Holliday junction resolvase RuvX [Riemerella anatipestifer]MDY3536766.1 Holliday junction resolvase RuvX [Riemerella anatipestifer]
MGQILAIDYGKARTGIAATDDVKLIASGLATVPTGELLLFLSEYIRSNVVEAVVVGYPVDLKGNVSEVETSILEFIEKFNTQFPEIEVHRLDERFTSKIASFFISQSGKNKKQRQEKGLIDKVSATIILQNFLDQKK